MEKIYAEVVRFQNSDVIATSGGGTPTEHTLTVSNFKNREKGDLSINFNGTDYKSWTALSSALGALGSETDRQCFNNKDVSRGLDQFYSYDSEHDDPEWANWGDLSDYINGTYVWYDGINRWHFKN